MNMDFEGAKTEINTKIRQTMSSFESGLTELRKSWEDPLGQHICQEFDAVKNYEIQEQIRSVNGILDKLEGLHKACEELESVFLGSSGEGSAPGFGGFSSPLLEGLGFAYMPPGMSDWGSMPATPDGGFSAGLDASEMDMDGPQKVKIR